MPVLYTFSPLVEGTNDPLNPDPGYDEVHDPKTLEAQFGDGYTASGRLGMNGDPINMGLTWTNVSKAEADYMNNFMKARKGFERFFWTIPEQGYAPMVWQCKKWSKKRVAFNRYVFTAEFLQRFDI